jgi:electron transport complex protein RnfC
LGIPFSQIKHPLSNGILIANPFQLYHTRQAVYQRQPKTEQILTLSGGALRRPELLKVRIGTSLSQILEQYDLLKETPYKTVINNPFWGQEILSFDQPVTHQINSLSFLTEKECRPRAESPCINCGLCSRICPVGLEPISIYKAIKNDDNEEALRMGIESCIECGLCSFSCPSSIPLADIIIQKKKEITL